MASLTAAHFCFVGSLMCSLTCDFKTSTVEPKCCLFCDFHWSYDQVSTRIPWGIASCNGDREKERSSEMKGLCDGEVDRWLATELNCNGTKNLKDCVNLPTWSMFLGSYVKGLEQKRKSTKAKPTRPQRVLSSCCSQTFRCCQRFPSDILNGWDSYPSTLQLSERV